MFVKVHKSYRCIVAICDEEILGKQFEEGQRQLQVRENFFKDKQANKEEIIGVIERYAREDATFNIAGKESVDIALEIGLIKKEQPLSIQGIPYVLVF